MFMPCEVNVLYWKSFESQNSTHLTLLKHQNTKTALYRLLKSHWVIALFKFFLVRQKKLLVTVLLDHPVKQEQFVRKVREIESGS